MPEQKYISVKYGRKQLRDSIPCSDADARLLAHRQLRALELDIARIWRSAWAPLGFYTAIFTTSLLIGDRSDAAIIAASLFATSVYIMVEGTRFILSFIQPNPDPVFSLSAHKLPELYAKKRAWTTEAAVIKVAPDYSTTNSR